MPQDTRITPYTVRNLSTNRPIPNNNVDDSAPKLDNPIKVNSQNNTNFNPAPKLDNPIKLNSNTTNINSSNSVDTPKLDNPIKIGEGEPTQQVKKVLNESELQTRRSEIDTELNDILNEKKEYLKSERTGRFMEFYRKTNPWGRLLVSEDKIDERHSIINEYDRKISELKNERLNLTVKLDPYTKEDQERVEKSLSMFPIDSNGRFDPTSVNLIKEIGINKVNRIESDSLNRVSQEYDKNLILQAEQSGDATKMFSFNAIKYGSDVKEDDGAYSDVNSIFENTIKDPMFYGNGKNFGKSGTFDINSKSSMLIENAKKYIDEKYPLYTPESKQKLLLDYSKLLTLRMSFDDKGNVTPEGLMIQATDNLTQLEDRYAQVSQEYDKLYNALHNGSQPWLSEEFKTLVNPSSSRQERIENLSDSDRQIKEDEAKQAYNDFMTYYNRISEKKELLNGMMEVQRKIMKTPEQRRGRFDFRDYGDGLAYNNIVDMATLGVSEMNRSLNIAGISKKVDNNEELSWEEQKALEQYGLYQSLLSKDTMNWVHTVGSGTSYMLPYIASFGLTGGVFKAGSSLAGKAVNKVATKAFSEATRKSIVSSGKIYLGNFSTAGKVLNKRVFSLTEMANDAVKFTGGALAQTLALPQYYIQKAAEEMTSDIYAVPSEEMNEIITVLDKNTGESLGKSAYLGLTGTFWETATERMGGSLMKASKIPGRAVKSLTGKDITKEIIVSKYVDLKGVKSTRQIVQNVIQEKLGWHGIVEEYYEELASQIGQMATSGDVPTLRQFLEDQWTTFATCATFGGGMSLGQAGVHRMLYGNIGNDVVYISSDNDKKTKEKIYIPKDVNDKLLKIFNESDLIDPDELNDLIVEYTTKPNKEDNLSEKQLQLIFGLAIQEGENKFLRKPVLQHLKEKGYNVDDVYEYEQAGEMSDKNGKLLTKEDVDSIVRKNKEISNKYPELAANGLLEKEPTGQYITPDINSLDATRKILEEQLNEQLTKDENGYVGRDKKEEKKLVSELESLSNLLQSDPENQELISKINETDIKLARLRNIVPEDASVTKKKLDTVEKYLDYFIEEIGKDFNSALPSEKNRILMDEMYDGKKLKATVSDIAGRVTALLTLEDGRQVKAFIGSDIDTAFSKKTISTDEYKKRYSLIVDAMRGKKEVEFKISPKEEWNKDDHAVETIETRYGDKIDVPYGDRIEVLVDGQFVAALQIHDYNERHLQNQKYEKAKEIFLENKAELMSVFKDKKSETGTTNETKTLSKKEQQDLKLKNAKEKFRDSAGEIISKFVEKQGGIKYASNNSEEKAKKLVKDLILSIAEMTEVKLSQATQWLKKLILQSNYNNNTKTNALKYINDNEEDILHDIKMKRLDQIQNEKENKPKRLNHKDIVTMNSDSVSMSSSDKIKVHLKTFGPVWDEIAEQGKFLRDDVEMEFYKMAKLDWDGVINDDTMKNYFYSIRNASPIRNAIINRMVEMPWSYVISFLNFYSNVTLPKQYGVYYTKKKGLEFKILNPSNNYEKLEKKFKDHVRTLDMHDTRLMLKKYAKDVNDKFSGILALEDDERTKLKIEQNENDLMLLEELTGISIEDWKYYFSDLTNETKQYESVDGVLVPKTYSSYEELLRSNAYRVTKQYWRQSNLMVNLLFAMMKRVDVAVSTGEINSDMAFEKEFKKFFLEGSGKTMSNLFKLSTSMEKDDDIGLSGTDIKGDLFSSFIQYSDLTNTAETILESNVNNAVVKHYKQIGEPIRIELLNGLHNLSVNSHKHGTSSASMSMEDIWTSLFQLYLNGNNTYKHNLGQFKDKPTIYLMDVPRYNDITEEQIEILDKRMGGGSFDEAVEYLWQNYILFSEIFPHDDNTYQQLREFVYNYAMNTIDTNQIFFGEMNNKSYPKGILSLVKRAGSTNSPGYRVNKFTEGGVGKTVRFSIANEKMLFDENHNKITSEAHDGMIFMSGEIAKRLQVSMGSIYSKDNEYPVLDSVKAVISYKNKQTNLRGLTKPNIVNIDVAAETGSSTYVKIQEYMKKKGIDFLSFTSSSKIIAEGSVIELFDKNGNINENADAIRGEHINDLYVDNIYIQQDLRHTIVPKSTKMPSPFLSNMMYISNGGSIAGLVYEMQNIEINSIIEELEKDDIDITKRKWLQENVNEQSQAELKRLLKAGLTIDDPTYRNIMKTIIISAVTKRCLEIPINRITTQEIPDVDNVLQGYKKTKDGQHVLLAEIITGYNGGREHDYTFQGKPDEAIAHVKANRTKYADLFDLAGNLMEWEITDESRNGIIPGEPIISSRVPAHGLVSHNIARLKKNLSVNFTMLNKKSQLASGSDNDGDQRYNQVLYKKNGNIFFEDKKMSKEALANRIMMLTIEDYTNPLYFDSIDRAIDKNTYDGVLEKLASSYSTENKTIKQGVQELFESNPELANSVYETLGFGQESDFKQTFKSSLWRGQESQPFIDGNGNLVLTPTYDSLFESEGISFAEDLSMAQEYGERYSKNPFIIEIDESYADSLYPLDRKGRSKDYGKRVVGDEREQRFVTKNDIVIPKGKFKIHKQKLNLNLSDVKTSVLLRKYQEQFTESDTAEHLRYGEIAKGYSTEDPLVFEQVEQELLKRGITKKDLPFLIQNRLNSLEYNVAEALGITKEFTDNFTGKKINLPDESSVTQKDINFYLSKVEEVENKLENKGTKNEIGSENNTQPTPQQKQQAQQLYSQYLDTIFPDSKVKDIVYHGSNQKINQFEVRKEPLIHFGNKNAALQRGDVLNQVVLNIKDLQTIKDGMWFLGTDEGGLLKELLDRNILTIEEVRSINEVKNKAIEQSRYFHEDYRMAIPEGTIAGAKKLQEILKGRNIGFNYINLSEDKGSTSYAVPSQEQIHILGSKQDIEGFKEFIYKSKKTKQIKYKSNNPLAFEDSRLKNTVGTTMKGILTQHNTLFSMITRYDMFLKSKKRLTIGIEDQTLDGTYFTDVFRLERIVNDGFGAIKQHIGNLQNLAFDNADDPKIEAMGLNEITANMFTLMLITDNRNSSTYTENGKRVYKNYESHYNAITESIGRQAIYFTSPLLKEFISMMRRNNGGMRNVPISIVWDKLNNGARDGNWSDEDVKKLKTLYYASAELSDLMEMIRLTREAPTTYSQYIKIKDIIDRIKKNDLKVFDTKSLFIIENGFPQWVPELRIIDSVMSMCEDIVFQDSIEETPVGKKIFNYVLRNVETSKKQSLSSQEIDDVSHALNIVFNNRMLKDNRTFAELKSEIESKYFELAKKYKGNTFFDYVGLYENPNASDKDLTNKVEIRIQPEYTLRKFSDKQLDDIRKNFASLPKEIKDLFIHYNVYRFGSTGVTSNGGFYTLFDDKSRVEVSKMASEELNDWYYDSLSPMEQYNIARWVIRINRNKDVSELHKTLNNITYPIERTRTADVNKNVLSNSDMHRDAMESLADINDIDQFLSWENQYNPDKGFRKRLEARFKISIDDIIKTGKLSGYKVINDKEQSEANKYFAQTEQDDEADIKNYGNSSLDKAMISEDNNLRNFIFEHLSKKYPTINFFTSREAFYEFVKKNSNRLLRVDTNAIGHAFKNAVYIDENTTIQDSMFHEYSHIYWDALPEDHKIKVALRKLYREQYGYDNYSDELVEEMIITDLGRIGTDFGNVFLTGSLFDRFILYVKDFWRTVKSMFGPLSKEYMMDDLAWAIWNNQDNIKPETKQGEAEIKNLVLYDNKEEKIDHDLKHNSVHINGKRIRYVTSVIKGYESSKFNVDERLAARLDQFAQEYERETKQKPTKEIMDQEAMAIETLWEEQAKAGTAVHMIAEEVFSNGIVPEEFISKYFGDQQRGQQVYEIMRQSLVKFKNELYKKYGKDIKFITEKTIISKNYLIAGIADLIVDLGDNNLLVFDYKTTSENYLNPDKSYSSYYIRSYGVMQAPLINRYQTKAVSNRLQLGIEKAMLEEQTNSDGNKNKVTGMFIVPVITKLDDNGKILSANIAEVVRKPFEEDMEQPATILDNLVPVKDDYEAVQALLKDHYSKQRNFEEGYTEFKTKIDKAKISKELREISLKAYAYMYDISGGNLRKIEYSAIEQMMGTGITCMVSELINNGFDVDDIRALPIEAFFNIYKDQITKERWEKEKETLMPLTVVGYNKVKVLNPERMLYQTWYHKTFDIENNKIDHYFYEAGTDSLRIGDEVMVIRTVKGAKKEYETYSIMSVVKVNKSKGEVRLKDIETGYTFTETGIGREDGILKIYEDENGNNIPDEDVIKGRNITKNNYIPRYKTVEEKVEEHHWDHHINDNSFLDDAEGRAKKTAYNIALKKSWKFFNEHPTLSDVREFVDDQQNVADLYHEFASLDANPTDSLIKFIQETAMTHFLANQIRIEHIDGPSTSMPNTINAYLMLTNRKEALYRLNDFKSWHEHSSKLLPPNLIDGKYVGINVIQLGLDNSQKKAEEDFYDIQLKLKKHYSEGTNINNCIREVNGRLYWRMPNIASLKQNEKELLELIYSFRYKYDPKYVEIRKRNEKSNDYIYSDPIPVSEMFITPSELSKKEGIGNKWAGIIHNLLKPGMYDDIVIKLEKDDVVGKKELMTYNDIKKMFIQSFGNKEEQEKWLGKKSKYIFINTPFLGNKINAGKLIRYYNKAQKIYREGDENNVKASQKGRRITTLGGRNMPLRTQYYLEAEEQVMQSYIEAMYLKRLAAPIDFILTKYDNEKTNAGRYLRKYTDTNVYKKSDDLGSEWSKLVDYIMRVTSLRLIAFSVKTTINNFVVGQISDVFKEPVAYLTGIGRFMSNPRKCIAILKKYGMANIVNDVKFHALQQSNGVDIKINGKVRTVSYSEAIDWGYIPMEWAEKANQLPVFIGLMTREEFDAYDSEAQPKDVKKILTRFRRLEITKRVNLVHGHYGIKNAAPSWNENLGKLLMMFKKFYTAGVYTHIVPYHYDNQLSLHAGVFNTVGMFIKLARFNFSKEDKRNKLAHDAIKRIEERRKKETIDNVFINGTQDYLDLLIEARDEGKIKFGQLSEIDKRNLWTAMCEMALITYSLIAYFSMKGGGDDEDPFEPVADSIWFKFLSKYRDDYFFFIAPENWRSTIETPAPALDYFINWFKMMTDLGVWIGSIAGNIIKEGDPIAEKGVYEKDTQYVKAGTPKWLVDITGIIPFGSLVKQILALKMKSYNNQLYLEYLEKNGYDKEMIEKIIDRIPEVIEESVTIGDIKKDGQMASKVNNILVKSGKWDNMSIEEIRDISTIDNYQNNIDKEIELITNYLEWQVYKGMEANDELNLDEVVENANHYDHWYNRDQYDSKKEVNNKSQYIIRKYNGEEEVEPDKRLRTKFSFNK